jgi:hypothetical protein
LKNLKIFTEKIVIRGMKFRRILNIEGDKLSDLPIRYCNGFPHCGFEGDILFVESKDDTFFMKVGQNVPEYLFQKILPIVRMSGSRLHTINEKVKERKATWFGTEDFEI